MRDPKRIDRVLELLRSYWHANPDLRLGQIVSNLTPARFGRRDADGFYFNDPFHVEDSVWEDILRERVLKIAKENQ